MKKLLAIVLSAVLLVSLLSACGGSGGGSAATTAAPETTAAAQGEETTKAEPATEGNTAADIQQGEDSGTVEQQTSELAKKAAPGEYFADLITIACNGGVNSWDPFARGGGFGVVVNIFEGLGVADKLGNFKAVMLKSIEKTDDVTYACELWDFITDTDGHNIKASDVAWSFDTYVASGNSGAVSRFDHIEPTGDYTFNIVLNSPFGIGEYEKQLSNFRVLSQEAYESDPDLMANNPVGTGPYKVKEFMEGSYGIFEANEDYWYNKIDDEAWLAENDGVWTYQNIKEIRCDVISDASARAIALENGSVDACASMNITDVQTYAGNPDYTVIDIPVNPPVAFYFNMSENSPCADINLRQAICYAIDNAGIAAGLDVPAFPVYGIQPRMFDAPKEWIEGREYYDYDPEKAKELLGKSNYNGETLTVLFSDLDQRGSAWMLIQAQLAAVGINVEQKVVEGATMQTLRHDWTAWDIMSDTFGGGSWVPNVVKRWSSDDDASIAPLICTGIEDPVIDGLYQELINNYSEEAIDNWDQYFTFESCTGYAICCFNNQTCATSKYVPVVSGNQYQLTPGAFTPVE